MGKARAGGAGEVARGTPAKRRRRTVARVAGHGTRRQATKVADKVERRRTAARVARFVASYHAIRHAEMHDIFRRISLKNGRHGMADKEHHGLCV